MIEMKFKKKKDLLGSNAAMNLNKADSGDYQIDLLAWDNLYKWFAHSGYVIYYPVGDIYYMTINIDGKERLQCLSSFILTSAMHAVILMSEIHFLSKQLIS